MKQINLKEVILQIEEITRQTIKQITRQTIKQITRPIIKQTIR